MKILVNSRVAIACLLLGFENGSGGFVAESLSHTTNAATTRTATTPHLRRSERTVTIHRNLQEDVGEGQTEEAPPPPAGEAVEPKPTAEEPPPAEVPIENGGQDAAAEEPPAVVNAEPVPEVIVNSEPVPEVEPQAEPQAGDEPSMVNAEAQGENGTEEAAAMELGGENTESTETEGSKDNTETVAETTEEVKEESIVEIPEPTPQPIPEPTPSPVAAPTEKPTVKPYVPSNDSYDPVKAEDEKHAEEQELQELETELKQEEKVARQAGGLGIFFGILAMIFTAHQMSENPDGLYASVCRLAITISSVVVKIICMPCRKLMGVGGGGNPYSGHMPISTNDYSYRNDPYRSNANAGFEMS
ncbi:unnamed protein product [Pseudo-nitzschia multistriata]|uniref:Uncharacterized protein n=1 Tax=Pseudo-nitzschia multistriata TaxID=183589 RepID=A0A448YYR8_9STRA|nr:unnamed protein product [Pseudo-nitzschia multistriata]